MSTLTKEWLLKTIAELEEERDATAGAVNEDATMALEAMKLALASLEAEAMTQVLSSRAGNDTSTIDKAMPEGTMLYTAPPAPVAMKDHQIRELVNELRDIAVKYHGSQQLREHIARTIRAAMLQGVENAETPTTMQTAPALDSSPKNAESASSNSPVTPDGWVMVPVEPTEDMIVNGFESEPDESFSDEKEWATYDAMSGCQQAAHRAKLCWAAMIAAAPQQEVK